MLVKKLYCLIDAKYDFRYNEKIISPQIHLLRGFNLMKSVKFLTQFWRDEDGAAAAEYALLLAIIAAGLAVAAGTLGTAISTAIDDTATCINTDGSTC